jgi:hypothetical protein
MQPHKEHHRPKRSPLPHRTIVDVDPEDPAQQLDESGDFHVEPLAVDAEPSAEAEDEFDQAVAETSAEEEEGDVSVDEAEAPPRREAGELYGVHTPRAAEHLEVPDDRDAFDRGENWLEALEQEAAETGPAPEHELDLVDDSDPRPAHPSTDFRDRPKADRGSGGPGGL